MGQIRSAQHPQFAVQARQLELTCEGSFALCFLVSACLVRLDGVTDDTRGLVGRLAAELDLALEQVRALRLLRRRPAA